MAAVYGSMCLGLSGVCILTIEEGDSRTMTPPSVSSEDIGTAFLRTPAGLYDNPFSRKARWVDPSITAASIWCSISRNRDGRCVYAGGGDVGSGGRSPILSPVWGIDMMVEGLLIL